MTDRKSEFLAELMIHLDFHHSEMAAPSMDAFFAEVASEPHDLVMAAMRQLRRAQWMPKPYDVLETVADLRREQRALVAPPRALPAELGDSERQEMLGWIKDFTDRFGGAPSKPTSPSEPSRTVVDMNDEVAKLRAADRAAKGMRSG